MIVLGSKLIDTPIMGLQTGSELARTKAPIIDPGTLHIPAYMITGKTLGNDETMLTIDDIREIGDIGMIVDSNDVFVTPDDVVKIKEIYEQEFPLVGLAVRDEKRRRLGKVTDYTVDIASFTIQQLIVKRPLLHSFSDTELIIHRSQIIEISNDGIVVHSETKALEFQPNEIVGSYVNPFRKSDPHGEHQPG